MHDKGNEENVFDRVDYQILDRGFASLEPGLHPLVVSDAELFRFANWRPHGPASRFNNGGLDPNGNVVGPADQRSQIKTFNIAPVLDPTARPQLPYLPSVLLCGVTIQLLSQRKPFRRPGAPDLQGETVGQNRTLTNAGLRSNISYVKGS